MMLYNTLFKNLQTPPSSVLKQIPPVGMGVQIPFLKQWQWRCLVECSLSQTMLASLRDWGPACRTVVCDTACQSNKGPGRIRINRSLPELSCFPHHLFPPKSLPYSQNALGKMSYYNEETQNNDEYNTTRLVHLIGAPPQAWTLAPRRWEPIHKLASDGSTGQASDAGRVQDIWPTPIALNQLCQNLHLHIFNPFTSHLHLFLIYVKSSFRWSLKVPEPKMVQVFAEIEYA